ncbi:MAG: hypothetical protein U0S36_07115 [Candidatus Nanopelagicales bacterium]
MTTSDRAAAYADLLAALLDARSDPATARFDEEVAAAEAAGTLDGATARNLRWWQRESVRGLADHLGEVLPALLVALVDADQRAAQSVADSAASWAAATAGARRGDDGPGEGAGDGPAGGDGGDDDPSDGPAPRPGGTEATGGSRPVLHEVGTRVDPPAGRTGPYPVPPPSASVQLPAPVGAGTGAPRRRLLVGGLTVLSDGARPGGAPGAPSL